MDKIEKIRQEIERRKKKNMYINLPMAIGRYYEDRDLLTFIGSLQQEQLEVDLEKEIDSYFKKWWMDLTDQGYILRTPDGTAGLISVKNVARHFYELGKQAKKEQMPMPEDTVLFQKGIEEGKRLMMEDAVEGTYNTADWGVPCIDLNMPLDLERFDKVKIVILKEDKQ